jgi:hypothetical protein
MQSPKHIYAILLLAGPESCETWQVLHYLFLFPPPPPSTPRNPRPLFTPHTIKRGVVRPTTPESNQGSDDDNDSLFSLSMLPKGHQLVMHGIVPTSNETPTAAMKNLLISLESDLHYGEFASYGLDVQPFSNRTSNLSSACYIKILSNGEASPCIDLLKIIRDAIVEAKLELEVRWSTG